MFSSHSLFTSHLIEFHSVVQTGEKVIDIVFAGNLSQDYWNQEVCFGSAMTDALPWCHKSKPSFFNSFFGSHYTVQYTLTPKIQFYRQKHVFSVDIVECDKQFVFSYFTAWQ